MHIKLDSVLVLQDLLGGLEHSLDTDSTDTCESRVLTERQECTLSQGIHCRQDCLPPASCGPVQPLARATAGTQSSGPHGQRIVVPSQTDRLDAVRASSQYENFDRQSAVATFLCTDPEHASADMANTLHDTSPCELSPQLSGLSEGGGKLVDAARESAMCHWHAATEAGLVPAMGTFRPVATAAAKSGPVPAAAHVDAAAAAATTAGVQSAVSIGHQFAGLSQHGIVQSAAVLQDVSKADQRATAGLSAHSSKASKRARTKKPKAGRAADPLKQAEPSVSKRGSSDRHNAKAKGSSASGCVAAHCTVSMMQSRASIGSRAAMPSAQATANSARGDLMSTRTGTGAAIASPRAIVVSPRAAANSPRVDGTSPGAAAMSALAAGALHRSADMSPGHNAASPRPAGTHAHPAMGRLAFVSTTRSGQVVVQPSYRKASAGTISSMSSASRSAIVPPPEVLHATERSSNDQSGFQPADPARSCSPLTYLSFMNGGMKGAQTMLSQQHECHWMPADHSQTGASVQQDVNRPVALPSGTQVEGPDSAYNSDSEVESSSQQSSSVHSLHSACSHNTMGLKQRQGAQLSSAWGRLGQQCDSVGNIAQLFMMRQRARMVFQVSFASVACDAYHVSKAEAVWLHKGCRQNCRSVLLSPDKHASSMARATQYSSELQLCKRTYSSAMHLLCHSVRSKQVSIQRQQLHRYLLVAVCSTPSPQTACRPLVQVSKPATFVVSMGKLTDLHLCGAQGENSLDC